MIPASKTAGIEVLTGAERQQWLDLLDERFGISPTTFVGYTILRPSHKYLWIAPSDHAPEARPTPESMGVVLLRTNLKYPKLTTGAAMVIGRHATRNVVSLDRARADAFLSRESTRVTREEMHSCTGKGYVIVRHDTFVLGVGLLYPDDEGGVVESLYPKAWASS